MFDVEIFSKTAKGRMEIIDRTLKLSPKLRQALILVDGRTAYGELKEVLGRLGEPAAMLEQLSQLGLVASDHDLPEMPEFPQTRSEDQLSAV